MSFGAQKKYVENSVKRGMIQERGLYVTMDSVSKQVKNRKWEELVKHPEAAVVPVIREFYANVEEHRNFRVFVKGRWVPFDRTTINRCRRPILSGLLCLFSFWALGPFVTSFKLGPQTLSAFILSSL